MQRQTQCFGGSLVTSVLALATWLAFSLPAPGQGRGTTGGGASGGGGGGFGGGGMTSGGGLSGGGLSGGLGAGSSGGGLGGGFSIGSTGGSGGLTGGFSIGGTGTGGAGGTGGTGILGGLGGTTGAVGGAGAGRGGAGVVSYGANTFLGPNYGNPLSLGMLNANGKATFGRVLYNTTTTATGTTGTGTATITRSTTATSTNINAIGVRRAPAYTASLGFPSRPTPPSAVLAEVQAVLDRSTRLPSRASIRAVMDGRVVVLQGMVQDDHERQLADSLVRLTPGVADVRNELSVRNPTPVETSQEP